MEPVLKRSEGAVAAALLAARELALDWANNWQLAFRLGPKRGGGESRVVGIEGWVDRSHRLARHTSNFPGPRHPHYKYTRGGPAETLRDSGRRTLRPTGENALQHDDDIVQQNTKGRERDEYGKHQGIIRTDLAAVE